MLRIYQLLIKHYARRLSTLWRGSPGMAQEIRLPTRPYPFKMNSHRMLYKSPIKKWPRSTTQYTIYKEATTYRILITCSILPDQIPFTKHHLIKINF